MHKAIPAYFLALIIIAVSILLGLLFERLLIEKWAQQMRRLKRPILKIISTSLRGVITIFTGLAGIFIALNYMPIRDEVLTKLNKCLTVLIILIFTILLARIVVRMIEAHGRRKKMPALTLFTNLTKIIIYVIGFLVILQSLGISITPLLTALGVGGLAVALALQDTLSNLFAGIHIISTRLVLPNDYIRLSTGEEGFVKDINWRNTIIRTMANNENIIPNSVLSSSILTNFSRPEQEINISIPVSVSYESDLSQVEGVCIAVAKEVLNDIKGGVKDYNPVIRYNKLGDNGIDLNIIMRVQKFDDQFPIKHELIKRLLVRFREEQILIPFPTRTVFLKSQSKISGENL